MELSPIIEALGGFNPFCRGFGGHESVRGVSYQNRAHKHAACLVSGEAHKGTEAAERNAHTNAAERGARVAVKLVGRRAGAKTALKGTIQRKSCNAWTFN
jgi:hypothetical protein